MSDERFDGMLLAIAQQHRGGIEELLETFFSFLRRKTDFFSQPDKADDAVKAVFGRAKDRYLADHPPRSKATATSTTTTASAVPPSSSSSSSKQSSKVEVLEDDDDDVAAAAAAAAKKKYEKELEDRKRKLEEAQKAAEASPADEAGNKPAGIKPNNGNGADYEKYSFTQTLSDVEMRIPLPEKNVKGKMIDVNIGTKSLRITWKNKPAAAPIIDDALFAPVKQEDSFWTIEDGSTIAISFKKINGMEWWKAMMASDPVIDLQKVQPENSKLDDLDAETRQTVEKMMFDQRQKAMGKPTSDEMKKHEMLQKFMSAHPEMDFSQAKIS